MDSVGPQSKSKVLTAMLIGTIFAALGDISLRHGMKIVSATELTGVLHAVSVATRNPYLLGGILLLSVFSVLYLTSLSWARLSFVLPLTGTIYIFVTIFAFFLLGEHITVIRLLGCLLIVSGVVLVSRT